MSRQQGYKRVDFGWSVWGGGGAKVKTVGIHPVVACQDSGKTQFVDPSEDVNTMETTITH